MSKRANPMDQVEIENEDSLLDPRSPEYQKMLQEFASGAKLKKNAPLDDSSIQKVKPELPEQTPASVELKSNEAVKMIINGRMKKRDETMTGCNFYITNNNLDRVNRLCSGNKGLIYNKLISIALDQLEATEGVLIYNEKDIDF